MRSLANGLQNYIKQTDVRVESIFLILFSYKSIGHKLQKQERTEHNSFTKCVTPNANIELNCDTSSSHNEQRLCPRKNSNQTSV